MPKFILAIAGIIFIVLVLAAIVYLVLRFIFPREIEQPKDTFLPIDAPAEPPLPPPPPVDPMIAVRQRYDQMYLTSAVPQNANILRVVTNNYSVNCTALRHYCWIEDGCIKLFPLWESLINATNNRLELVPLEWNIPCSDIVCFAMEQGLPTKFVVLQFRHEREVINLAFEEDAHRVFCQLIPEKDFSHLLDELYPKSSKNIRDIRENFQSLRELREDELITEEEYAAKKKEMLILM